MSRGPQRARCRNRSGRPALVCRRDAGSGFRDGQADVALAELLEKHKEGGAFQIAEVYAFRGETDKAFEWLEQAYAQRDPGFSGMKGDPLLKNLEADPRHTAFLKKLRLPL